MQDILMTGVEKWDQDTFVIGGMICVIVLATLFYVVKWKIFDKHNQDDYDPWDIERDR